METRVCSQCKEELPATKEYFHKSSGKTGLHSHCRMCAQILYLIDSEAHNKRTKENYIKNKDRILKQCKKYYNKNKQYILERCQTYREYNSDIINEKQRGIKRRKQRINSYGVTEEYIQSLMDFQKGCCAICGSSLIVPESRVSYCIDHNHTTGEVRGLLCSKCNTLLGFALDNKTILASAINYLIKYA